MTSVSFSPTSALKIVEPSIEGLSPEDAQAKLDGIIEQAEEFIRLVGTLRNAQAKISLLPREILSWILVKAVEPRTYDSPPAPWHEHVTVSAVCTLFRAIALQTPAFWACIPLHPCPQLPEMIARSKAHPLSVRLSVPWDFSAWCKGIVRQLPQVLSAERLLDFQLSVVYTHAAGSAITPLTVLENFPASPTPLLRSLKISLNTAFALPAHVLAAPKLSLQHLTLEHISEVDWQTMRNGVMTITRLASLELAFLSPPIPRDIVHGLISASPRLESLRITCALSDDRSAVDNEEQQVSLEFLDECYLEEPDIELISDLLHWLKVPAHISRWSIFSPRFISSVPGPGQVKTLMKYCRVYSTKDTTTMHPRRRLKIGLTSHEVLLQFFPSSQRSQPNFTLRMPPAWFSTILSAINVPTIEDLELTIELAGSPRSRQYCWTTFFRRHRRVKIIQLHSASLKLLTTRGLAPRPVTKESPSQSVFPLRQLKTIRIHDVYRSTHDVPTLSAVLALRKAAGYPLAEMDISQCSDFTKEQLRGLEESIAHLII